jgi:hypothetical protein
MTLLLFPLAVFAYCIYAVLTTTLFNDEWDNDNF